MIVTEQQVYDQLKTVLDPEMMINVVDLGLIYSVRVDELKIKNEKLKVKEECKVFILMTLTSPGCPLAAVFDDLIGGAVRQIQEVKEVNIELTWDPPWNQSLMSEEAKAELGIL